MEVTIIQQAVTMLQQQGKAVSVRSVHQLTGGSFRDISRILRELQPSLLPSPHGSAATPQPTAPPQPALSPDVAHLLQQYRALVYDVWRYRGLDVRGWTRWPTPAQTGDGLLGRLAAVRQRLMQLGVTP